MAREGLPPGVRQGVLRGDLSLLRGGISLGRSFGFGSLEELARVAEQLEKEIYLPGSFQRTPEGFQFLLGNPPLRIGAFHTVRIFCNGTELPPPSCTVATDLRPAPRALSSVSVSDPLTLDLGEGSQFAVRTPEPLPVGPHRVQVQWTNVAIPPVVWLEFFEPLAPMNAGP